MNTTDNLPRDASTAPIQIGNYFKTSDATSSPVTSPMTLNGSVQTISVPDNAVEIILYPVAHALKVSELLSMAQYDSVAVGSKESFPCSKMTKVYVQGTNTDTLYFRFTTI